MRGKITAPTPDASRPVRKPRRLIVVAADDSQIALNGHDQIELTGIVHASAKAPMRAIVQEQCSLGDWHDRDWIDLPCWGAD